MINQVEYWPAGCYRRWRAGPEEAGLHLGGFGSGALLVGQDGDGLRELEEYFAVDVALAGAVAARRRTGRPFARNKTAPVASPINRSSFPVLYQFFVFWFYLINISITAKQSWSSISLNRLLFQTWTRSWIQWEALTDLWWIQWLEIELQIVFSNLKGNRVVRSIEWAAMVCSSAARNTGYSELWWSAPIPRMLLEKGQLSLNSSYSSQQFRALDILIFLKNFSKFFHVFDSFTGCNPDSKLSSFWSSVKDCCGFFFFFFLVIVPVKLSDDGPEDSYWIVLNVGIGFFWRS